MKSNWRVFTIQCCVVVSVLGLFVNASAVAGPLPTAKPEEVGLSSERLQRMSSTLKVDVEKGMVPGVVALVARGGRIAYFESFGWRDKEAGAPMQNDAIFRVYSMTKPFVSVAAMMLHEEGRFFLEDPVSKYLPEFSDLKLGVESPHFSTVPLQRTMTVQDLLRHTSGITYGVFGKSVVKSMYMDAKIWSFDQTLEDMLKNLAKIPLVYEPGTQWEYGRSTDVVGRLIEVISGMPLDQFLETRVFQPLKMADAGFWVKPENHNRIAQPAKDPKTGKAPEMINVTAKPKMLSGGGGGVATAGDYVRFAQMLLNGGELEGVRLLSPKTVEYMTSDHLGPMAKRDDGWYLPGPGYGFGLGFAVRLDNGRSAWVGSKGDYYWGGWGGTYFWVDPREKLIAVLMIQDPDKRLYYRRLFRSLVYQALIE
jgi:CubicO group peptidase (beta-lactamase class C family)